MREELEKELKDISDGEKTSTSATLLLCKNKYTIDQKRNKKNYWKDILLLLLSAHD